MKVAVIGSRNITVIDLEKYLPAETKEIISGGARGVDLCANLYAKKAGIKLTEIYPEYEKYGKAAPLIRNDEIIARADLVLAFWDGKSRGTKYVIDKCKKVGKPIKIEISPNDEIKMTFDELLESAFTTFTLLELEKQDDL